MLYNVKKEYEKYIKDIQIYSTTIYFFKEEEIDIDSLNSFMELVYTSINNILSSKQYLYGEITKRINEECNNFLGYEDPVLSFKTEYTVVLDIPLLGNFSFIEDEKDILDTLESESAIENTVRKIIYEKAEMYIDINKMQLNYDLIDKEKYFIVKHRTGLIEYVYKDLSHLTANPYKLQNSNILYKYGNVTMSNTGRIVFIPCNEREADNILVKVIQNDVSDNIDDIISIIDTTYGILYEFNIFNEENSNFYIKDLILQK